MAGIQLKFGGLFAVLSMTALLATPVCFAQGLLVSNSTWRDLGGNALVNPGDTSNTPVTPIVRYNATTGWLSVDTRGVNCLVDSVPDLDGNYPTVGGDDVGFASIIVEGPEPIFGTEAPWLGTIVNGVDIPNFEFGMLWQPLRYEFGKAQMSGLAVDSALLPPGLYDLWQYSPGLTMNDFDVLPLGDTDGIAKLEVGLNETVGPPARGMPPIFSQFEIVSGIWGDLNDDNVVDDLDIDALASAAGMGSTDPKYDLNFDCNVDFGVSPSGELNTDSDELIRVILGTEYADANLDKKVDFLDVSSLSGGFGTSDRWALGNFNGDNVIDFLDVSTLSGFFGADNTVLAVPEPSVFAAVWGALIAVLGAQWRVNTLKR